MSKGTQLIALQAAFYGGQRLRKGAEFTQVGDTQPKWAAVKGTPEAVIQPEQVAADTKPKATQAAVKKKVTGLTERA